MPDSFNHERIQAVLDGLRVLGIDNINLFVNAQRLTVCDVGWAHLRVRGLGVDADSAIADANTKIREAIAVEYPTLALPSPT